jgi:large subunit ribosomal protein L25
MPTQSVELRAEPRSEFGKHVRRLRRRGLVPGNIFGHGASRAFQAPLGTLEHLLTHGGRTGLVSINLNGEGQTALLKEIQRDPRSGQIVHLAFQAVSLEETVTSTVPLRFTGHPLTQLRIEARAADLPEAIEVDLTGLEDLHAAIHVRDLPVADSYRILESADEVVAIILPPKVEVEEIEEVEEAAAAEAPAEAAAEAEGVSED